MWVTLFGFDGFAVLKRLKKQLNNDRDKINNLLLSSMKSADKPCKLSVSNLKMLAPEEILEIKCDVVQACKATLQDIVIVTAQGKRRQQVAVNITRCLFCNMRVKIQNHFTMHGLDVNS